MGPRKGRPRKGELADMTIYPPGADGCGEPSFDEPVEKFEVSIILTAGHKAGVVDHYRTGTTEMVAFAAWQAIGVNGGWAQVCRIDTWHGNLHRHDFAQGGDSRITILEPIPIDHAEKVIGVWRDWAKGVMMTEWQRNVRRWRGDTE